MDEKILLIVDPPAGSNDYNWLPPNQIKPFIETHPGEHLLHSGCWKPAGLVVFGVDATVGSNFLPNRTSASLVCSAWVSLLRCL